MKFNVYSEIEYAAFAPGTIILNLHAMRTPHQTVINETFNIEPYIKVEEFKSGLGENRVIRFEIRQGSTIKLTYRATVDTYCEIKNYDRIIETPVAKMNAAVFPYLYPSRYCQSDKLYRLAYNLFGHIINPFEKVSTLTDWIHRNVQYLSGSTNAQTSAFDTVTEQSGVCRDFAHLGIALCRALTIPARYFTGYAFNLQPQDFHACFEAYIGDEWILFDATRLVPLNGLVKIASGRDAGDTAIANIFGGVNFNYMNVRCELAESGFNPFYYEQPQLRGLSYL